MTSIAVNQNTKNTNVILGDVTKTIWGQAYITDYIHLRSCETGTFAPTGEAIAYHISPQSFYQVNPMQTEKLYSLVLDYAGLTGREIVWICIADGQISLFLHRRRGRFTAWRSYRRRSWMTAIKASKQHHKRRVFCRKGGGRVAGVLWERRREHRRCAAANIKAGYVLGWCGGRRADNGGRERRKGAAVGS